MPDLTDSPGSRKFGKQIQKRQLDLPEYAASFLNYKALKKLIKQLSATPTIPAQSSDAPPQEVIDPQAALRANKEVFFFRLEREIEKVNVFYLQKEAEFALRLKTLLDKKRVIQSRLSATSKVSAAFVTLLEGFQAFDSDLNKLQQFVEVNETAISKILKKWDKTSKSRTKELYLQRAVEVQPCFNRDVLRDLSDRSTTARLELEAWAEGENISYDAMRSGDHIVAGQTIGTEDSDTDIQLLQATTSGNLPVLREWTARLKSAPDARERFTRTFLAAIPEASKESLDLLLDTLLVDIQAEDDVNERNCLHEAAITGRNDVLGMGLAKDVDVSRVDVYGRIPLHYACLHGRVDMVHTLIAADPNTVDLMDHDNFTPLIHSIVRHQFACVEQVLFHNARIDPATESDHVPLNLACQYGSAPVVSLLLQRGAKLLPDAEGLYPQHLLARSGHCPDLLLQLKEYGADLDQRDKLYQWTPIFHAASEGRVASLQTLLENGVDVNALDEKGLSAMYYATWEGNLECMRLLWSRSATSGLLGRRRSGQIDTGQAATLDQGVKTPEAPPSILQPHQPDGEMNVDGDTIPPFVLPPPIIPLRRYGHNFIDTKTFVQISFEESGPDPIRFYQEGRYPAARLTITSKLSDLIPRNVILPIQEDFRVVSFQIDNLESFAVDFDIFPTFGSKVISKTVALPEVFKAISSSSGTCCLPLFDPRLRAIGEITFKFQVIKPFQGDPLEITHFATYWKATSALDSQSSGFITGSSLSGNYVQLFVQLTRDVIPILWPRYTINHHGIELPICRLTYAEFQKIGADSYGSGQVTLPQYLEHGVDLAQMHVTLHRAFLSLQDALALLPTSVHVNISVLYPTLTEEQQLNIGPTMNINLFADAILRDVFDSARKARERNTDFMRSVVFTSFNAQICTALNWKQPNYPVLLCNDLGESRDQKPPTLLTTISSGSVQSSGRSSMSVKEAARTAQSNNFMGLICRASLLDMVPALIESIKELGLVLVADTSDESDVDGLAAPRQMGSRFGGMGIGMGLGPVIGGSGISMSGMSGGNINTRMPDGVNGTLKGNGVLKFFESIDM